MELLISKAGVKIISDQIFDLKHKISNSDDEERGKFSALLIEVITIAKRMYVYLDNRPSDPSSPDMGIRGKQLLGKKSQEDNMQVLEELITPILELLHVSNVLLMCIIELMVNILNNKHNLLRFRSNEAIENILSVLTNSDDTEIK